jgi:hypothetical protein
VSLDSERSNVRKLLTGYIVITSLLGGTPENPAYTFYTLALTSGFWEPTGSTRRIGKTSPVFAKRADKRRDVKSEAGERKSR